MAAPTSILLLCWLAFSEPSAALLPIKVDEITTTHPGFVGLAKNTSAQSGNVSWNLIITRFNGIPFSTDYVSMVRDIGHKGVRHIVEDITSELHWPNEPNSIPGNVFGTNRENMIAIPSGFLVPTKGQGAMTIFDLETSDDPHQVSSDNDGDWFYHRAVWLDMDNDGLLDIVTCRAKKPIFGSQKGELLWLKHPSTEVPWSAEWQETILAEGHPDTFLIPVMLKPGGGETVQTLVTAGFFSQSLDVWWRKDETKPWSSDNLQSKVLDRSEGDTFDLVYEDLDNDNQPELLVTYNKATNGTVIVYEVPSDIRQGILSKHLLMDGFEPFQSGVGKGAPGGIKVTWPDLRNKTGRPDIILSGDDNGRLYLLRAKDSTGWVYEGFVLLDVTPGTMGGIAVGDIDGDNYTEIIAPSYNDGKVSVLTYNPKSIPFIAPPSPEPEIHVVYHIITWIYSWIPGTYWSETITYED